MTPDPARFNALGAFIKPSDNINSGSALRLEFSASDRGPLLIVIAGSQNSVRKAESIISPLTHCFQFRIEQPDAGKRLDEFFASRFGTLSRMRIANLIEAGVCLVNGAVARAGYRMIPGDSVDISFDDGAPTAMSAEPIPLEVIYEDEHLIAVVKPAGMLVHPTMSVKTGTLANALAYYFNREFYEGPGSELESNPGIGTSSLGQRPFCEGEYHPLVRPGLVHRLDRATSGLMVVARTPRALTILSRHFRKRLVKKSYVALVSGTVEEESGSIKAPIGRDADRQPRWRVIEGGKPAETRFKIIERLDRATLLELEPVTGRTNQLRIHCAHIGHHIIGDEMYDGDAPPLSNFGLQTDAASAAGLSATRNLQVERRLCLHACGLAFHHPVGGAWLEFVSPAPDSMQAIIRYYRNS